MKRGSVRTIDKRRLRTLRGPFTQSETAELTKIRIASIQDWETGRAQPSAAGVRRLIDHFTTWKKQYGQDPQPTVDEILLFMLPELADQAEPKGE